jgi:hypothetical protein
MQNLVFVFSYGGVRIFDYGKPEQPILRFRNPHPNPTSKDYESLLSPIVGFENGHLVYDPFCWVYNPSHQNVMVTDFRFAGKYYRRLDGVNFILKALLSLLHHPSDNVHVLFDTEMGSFYSSGEEDYPLDFTQALTAADLGCHSLTYRSRSEAMVRFLSLLGTGLVDEAVDTSLYYFVDGPYLYRFSGDQVVVSNLLRGVLPIDGAERIDDYAAIQLLSWLMPEVLLGNYTWAVPSLSWQGFDELMVPIVGNHNALPDGKDGKERRAWLNGRYFVMAHNLRKIINAQSGGKHIYISFSLKSYRFDRFVRHYAKPANASFMSEDKCESGERPFLEQGLLLGESDLNSDIGVSCRDYDHLPARYRVIDEWVDLLKNRWPDCCQKAPSLF